ncbi:VOC family protein [Stackebrandtia nassauensis]|uniref:3-demethylubiquinone-9 3-methyltransferase n=1 Tax=Stackebrandtia nassauensis (strain DSM 44728 / CIP 108903 / NRRL B-16338 / NBRC 102104 / LLR-40K-21) TaxID=446470 RepID=D3Q5X1_STANL|nr:VOC family protein [Stackebrandtia nassauensis]ADD40270.1 3-demethylubiquinone-9 3-methyltransferase [Stackebrandtia nassauensis DSM 44728]
MSKISTSLWFDTQAEEAVNFYTSLIPNSKIKTVTRYGDENPDRSGQVMTIDFELDGQQYNALNGGPEFTFNEAASILVDCESQEEIDRLWAALSEGGEEGPCGWLKDKYGLSWQINSTLLMDYIVNGEPEAKLRAVQAMYKMSKLDNAVLKAAYEGE